MTSVRRVCVASCYADQPAVVEALRAAGHEVYDCRHPHGDTPDPPGHLQHPVAMAGSASDFEAMQWADTFVLVLPCGRSAHLKLGWAVGQGKRTAIVLNQRGFDPELKYRMVDLLATSTDELLGWLQDDQPPEPSRGRAGTEIYDLSGGQAGPVLDPDTPIRLIIESVAGVGWDGENDSSAFCWDVNDRVVLQVNRLSEH